MRRTLVAQRGRTQDDGPHARPDRRREADARNMMKTTLGSDGPTSGTSPIIERYLVRLPLDNSARTCARCRCSRCSY
ncbi:hypothetical protein STRTUCAR8_09196 [Streptomyces turgidiscabies Car8]|uniref:Uncharacterized protein n=1 Tax=Streptomyces turgidiscabies (strain Car8) TaxID=698760 RepID=L7F043_STRT8|nr:hypothetical protein STRTUCAR8_09196 [Streptomyces turgidiscabies Car8]